MWSTVRAAAECTALPIKRFDATELPVRFAGEVRDFDPTDYFGPKDARRQDRVTQLGFGAAADALADAGELGADPGRCAVIAATGVGGLETMEDQPADVHRARRQPGEPVLRHHDDAERHRGRDLHQLRFDRPRPVHRHGVRGRRQRDRRRRALIRDGSADVVVAGGAEARVTPLTISAFARMGALEHAQRRSGPGFASVRRVARRFRDRRRVRASCARAARARGRARCHVSTARSLGYGRNGDAYHITAPSPGGAGAAVCMQLALDDAGARGVGRRPRERARYVHAAQRRVGSRGLAQGVRRPRSPGHVHEGRHRSHDRCGRCRGSGDLAALAARRDRPAHREPGEDRRRDRPRHRVRRAPAVRSFAGALELVRLRRSQRHADPHAGGSTVRRRDRTRTANAHLRAPQRSGRSVPSGSRRAARRAGSASTAESTAAPSARPRARRSSGPSISRSSSASRSWGGSPAPAPT